MSACYVIARRRRLAAQRDDLREKIRCLEAALELDPDLERARSALEEMRQRLVRKNERLA